MQSSDERAVSCSVNVDALKLRIVHAIENSCESLFTSANNKKFIQEIAEAHRYPMRGHGKLIRPLLVLLAAGSFGGDCAVANAMYAAVAVELVHTYSLVHDDLPCMDNDSMRRGQPATHVVYGEAKALLVGDGLLTAAFELLANQNNNQNLNSNSNTNTQVNANLRLKLIQSLSKAIGSRGMVLGQWLDMTASSSESDDWEMFRAIHTNKTGKLFGACFEMGYLCAQKFDERELSLDAAQIKQNQQNEMFQIGVDVGFAFQIMDDILDATRSADELGKTSGKDAEQNKLTAVKILGLDGAKTYAKQCLGDVSQKLAQIYNDRIHLNSNDYLKNLFNLIDTL